MEEVQYLGLLKTIQSQISAWKLRSDHCSAQTNGTAVDSNTAGKHADRMSKILGSFHTSRFLELLKSGCGASLRLIGTIGTTHCGVFAIETKKNNVKMPQRNQYIQVRRT